MGRPIEVQMQDRLPDAIRQPIEALMQERPPDASEGSALPNGLIKVHLSAAHLSGGDPNRLAPLADSSALDYLMQESADQGLCMLIDVQVDKECLVGCIAPELYWHQAYVTDVPGAVAVAEDTLFGVPRPPLHGQLSRSEVLDGLVVALRLPLLLASAWKLRAREGHAGRQIYGLAISRPVLPQQIRNLQVQHVCQDVPEDVNGTWLLECSCEPDLQDLLAQLELAGCIMQDLADRYALNQLIGVGSSAKVFLANDQRTGDMVAVKARVQTSQW